MSDQGYKKDARTDMTTLFGTTAASYDTLMTDRGSGPFRPSPTPQPRPPTKAQCEEDLHDIQLVFLALCAASRH